MVDQLHYLPMSFATQTQASGLSSMLVPFMILGGVMFFFVLLPQWREQKSHDAMLAALVKGDGIVTKSGMHGKITEVGEEVLVIEIGDKTKVKFDRSVIARKLESK